MLPTEGVALILASTLLTVYYFRKGYDALAAGFLMFAIGEGLILSCSAADLEMLGYLRKRAKGE